MSEALIKAIVELQEQEAIRLVKELLDGGTKPADILAHCQAGMTRVGELFEQKKYYLSELIYSGSIFNTASELLKEALEETDAEERRKGTVVIGTIKGDVHDLGKNIVVMLLKASGYQVEDLGVDVEARLFVEKAQEHQARVIGISALLTTSFPGMKEVVDLLEEQGLRRSTKVMIGGGVVDEISRKFVGADAQSNNAYQAVVYCDSQYRDDR